MNQLQIKEKIGVLKIFLSISLVIFVSTIAWIFQNFNQVNTLQLFIAIVTLFVMLKFVSLMIEKIYKLINDLGEE